MASKRKWEEQGQPASSQPSQGPTAAEPRNRNERTNTDETMMGRAPQSAREKTAMEEKIGVMMWPSWAQRASGPLGPCILEPAGPWTQIPLIELWINRAIGPSGP